VDAVLNAALSAAPQVSGAGILIVIIVLLLRREGAELARERTAHDAEMAEKHAEITALRTRVEELNTQVDRERALRRAAEDAARPPAGGTAWAG
jgi:cell division protein FtsB